MSAARFALLADTSATVLGMPIALFPAINAAYFRGNPQTLGLLVAAPAFGGLLGAALSGPVRHVSRQGWAMLVAGAVWGLALTGFGLTHSLWPALALLAIAGAADTLAVVFRTTVVQLATPDRYRGRVSAAEYVVGVGCPQLGNFRAGLIVASAIPLAMLFAVTMMEKVGIAGSLMSLGAIDFGLVVDSSVVMVENCVRHLAHDRTDRPKLDVIRDAAVEVRKPTMFGELIIMIVYLPILTLQGIEGKLFRPMALAVIFAMVSSTSFLNAVSPLRIMQP